MTTPSKVPSPRLRALLWTTSIVIFLVTAEVVCRAYFATQIGVSVLFYGTSFQRNAVTSNEQSPLLLNLRDRRMSGVGDSNNSVRHADNRLPHYFKYFPHQQRSTYDMETGEVYPVTINEHGFRGRDFTTDKPAGVIRVVTLGASSTFGYHDRDDMTYPAQLERLLNQSCPGRTYEVINLGIPHLLSKQILALFDAEGLPLRPDVVTFYEGFNDANEFDDDESDRDAKPVKPFRQLDEAAAKSLHKGPMRWMRDRFLIVALQDALVAGWTQRFSSEQVEQHVDGRRNEFLKNLSELKRRSDEARFTFIVASQQSRSMQVPREGLAGFTSGQELGLVADMLARQGWLGMKEAAFWTHGELMKAEAAWAAEHGVEFVDVRGALDSHRDTVVSWVHLNHEGNGVVAHQLAPVILEKTCPASGAARELPTSPGANSGERGTP